MPWRRSLVGLVLALATACSASVVDLADPTAEGPGAETTTTTSSTTTTTAPPPADIRDLIVGTTMTERARRLFLAASPAIEDAATFARNCGGESAVDASGLRTHTQGCYVAGRIHLRAPDRPEAHELLYVVAAHELLHAAYAMLSPAERAAVDTELAATRAGNERLEERLRPYRSAPTLVNEVHAILGSEFEDVSPALEAHYAQYFTNRAAVVAARQRTLGGREDEMRRLKAEIDELDGRIETLRESQERLRAAGDIRGFNASVPTINGLIDRYNTRVDALNTLIEEYNALLGG